MITFIVITIIGVVLLSIALHQPNHDHEFLPHPPTRQHSVSMSTGMENANSYDSDIDSMTLSPSHPMIFGYTETSGSGGMVARPTPKKRNSD